MYAMRAHIAYINCTKKLRIFNILNYFCVVYVQDKAFVSEDKDSTFKMWMGILFVL